MKSINKYILEKFKISTEIEDVVLDTDILLSIFNFIDEDCVKYIKNFFDENNIKNFDIYFPWDEHAKKFMNIVKKSTDNFFSTSNYTVLGNKEFNNFKAKLFGKKWSTTYAKYKIYSKKDIIDIYYKKESPVKGLLIYCENKHEDYFVTIITKKRREKKI